MPKGEGVDTRMNSNRVDIEHQWIQNRESKWYIMKDQQMLSEVDSVENEQVPFNAAIGQGE